MSRESELSCTVAGGFNKFKPEIDKVIEEFEDLGVHVLAPDKGWSRPTIKPYTMSDLNAIRPLYTERDLPISRIEPGFLKAINKSDFLYVVNPEGFIGDTVSFEIGYAFGGEIPVYSQRPIPYDPDMDLGWIMIMSGIKTLNPSETVSNVRGLQEIKTWLESPIE